MKKVIYTMSFALLAGSLSAQVVSTAKIFVSEGAVVSFGQDVQNNGELINKGQIHFKNNLSNEGVLISEGNVVFDGYTQQTLSGTNDVVLSKVTLENDIDLKTSLVIDQELNYSQGIISSSEESALVFSENANHYGASDYSHSVGVVTKLNASNFEFPVGDGSNYRGFEANSSQRKSLSAEYKAQNPNEFSKELANGVDFVNDTEYWILKSSGENDVAEVSLIGTYNNNVAYLKKGAWNMAEGATLDKNSGLERGVVFTSGRGKYIKKDIGVWPNPTRGDFNLKLVGMDDNDQIEVTVINQIGRTVLGAKGTVAELRKVYSLPAGMITTELTVRVINGDDILTEKMILNR